MTSDMVITRMYAQQLTGFEWLAGYIATIVELYRPESMLAAELDSGVDSTIRQLKELHAQPSEGIVKNILFSTLESAGCCFETPDAVKEFPFPVRPTGQAAVDSSLEMKRQLLLTKHSQDLLWLNGLRTVDARVRGRNFAAAAMALRGNFHWIPTGPEQGPERKFLPKERWTQTVTETGVEEHPEKRDDFAIWLNRGGKEPGAGAYMNCWEAVFFSAYKAGLSVQKIRLIHAKATQAARDAKSGTVYYSKLMEPLKRRGVFPLVPEIGLMPEPGDIIFVDEDQHVALCVGIEEAPDWRESVQAMSHWIHPSDGFNLVSIADFVIPANDVRFAPCPFGEL